MPTINLPDLHAGQIEIWKNRGRKNAVRCGRRFGKTKLLETIACDVAAKGGNAGVFTPEYKQWEEIFRDCKNILKPIYSSASKTDGLILTNTNGQIDFWSLNDNDLAGRGRKYNVVLLDESAFTKNGQMYDTWQKAIEPTLLTTRGSSFVFSTPSGIDEENFFYRICHDASLGFTQHYAPSAANPYVPVDELSQLEKKTHPLVFQQEYRAEFISWANATFFKLEYFLDEAGLPVPYPTKCDLVFAVLDCAVKSGTEHDATGTLYCAYSRLPEPNIVWLDYEMDSIDAAFLDQVMSERVLTRLEDLARECGARLGNLGMFVEDAAGGSVMLQNARSRENVAPLIHAIDSKMTAKGKDERSIIAGGPISSGAVKISQYAFDKIVDWKGRSANHLLKQVTTFRLGDKDAARRADDLHDSAMYSVIVALTDKRQI